MGRKLIGNPLLCSFYCLVGGLILAACSVPEARAFSLLGPYEAWMVPQTGFAQPGDIGGPMNLGQEYRWNVPVLAYAFDQSFLDYFGSNGVAAVESAIGILNSLPPVSESSPTNFPLQATSINFQAQAEGLFDLKSQALALRWPCFSSSSGWLVRRALLIVCVTFPSSTASHRPR